MRPSILILLLLISLSYQDEGCAVNPANFPQAVYGAIGEVYFLT